MSPSHHLEVSIRDEGGGTLNVTAVQLKPAVAPPVGLPRGVGGAFRIPLSGLGPGQYELRILFADRPEQVFPLSLTHVPTGLVPTFSGERPACCSLVRNRVGAPGNWTELVFSFTFKLASSHSEVVLVAGWDYSGGANNAAYAESCRDDLYTGFSYRTGARTNVAKRIHDSTVVTLFDFKTGHRVRMVRGASGWFEMDRVLQGTVKTHLGYYRDPASVAKRYGDDSISIRHVYEYVADLGVRAPGTLKEFHFFSHAWAGGPILVETYQDARYDAGGSLASQRDPRDKDPRTKDFEPLNMPRLSDFKAAFAADAIAKVWGCMATHAYRNLIRAAARVTSDASAISFDWQGTQVNTTAGQAKQYLRQDIIGRTYMARMAAAVGGGLKVYGAPPGMGADLRAVSVGGRRRNYMYVNRSTYRAEFEFLRNAMGMVPDDTGYILFS